MGCGHLCCDIEDNEYHSHCIEPESCQLCDLKRNGQIPTITIDRPVTSSEATGEHEMPTTIEYLEVIRQD